MKKLLLSVVIALTACGGSSNSSDSGEPGDAGGLLDRIKNGGGGSNGVGGSIPSSIAGLWDASFTDPEYGFDENYLGIDSKGNVVSYDYAGDPYDDWGNCYWITKSELIISSLGGSKYRLTDTDPELKDEFLDVEIKVSGNTMTFSSQDVDDDDEDGNTTEMLTDTYTRSSRTIASFTPECSDSRAAARALIPAKNQKSSLLLRAPAAKL